MLRSTLALLIGCVGLLAAPVGPLARADVMTYTDLASFQANVESPYPGSGYLETFDGQPLGPRAPTCWRSRTTASCTRFPRPAT